MAPESPTSRSERSSGQEARPRTSPGPPPPPSPPRSRFPAKYIYEPWKAPIADQKAAGCIIGQDYPKPIVIHETASKVCMDKMNKAYAADKAAKAELKADAKAASGQKRKLSQTKLS